MNATRACLTLALLAAVSWPAGAETLGRARGDAASYANVDQFQMTHLEFILDVDFHFREFAGSVILDITRLDPKATQLVLDSQDLNILDVNELTADFMGATEKPKAIWVNRPYRLDKPDAELGSALVIELPPSTEKALVLKIDFETLPKAPGLHWLVPAQKESKHPPFVYTDAGPLAARSWMPLQDTAAVRVSYRGHIHTPDDTLAVMGAGNDVKVKRKGDYWFVMTTAVAPAQLSLAVGDLRFKAMSSKTGVFADSAMLGPAAKEFADTEAMLAAGTRLIGGDPLDRFDVLVMPPTFPRAGADNARVASVSPTLITGDKSLLDSFAAQVADAEITNRESAATPADAWITRGLAAYVGSRIMASVYGAPRAAEQALIAREHLRGMLATLEPADQVLYAQREGPALTAAQASVSSEKGRLFFGFLETRFGDERIDAFLHDYFDHFAGQTVGTQQFLAYLQQNLLDRFPGIVTRDEVLVWVLDPGLPPDSAPPPAAFEAVDAARTAWLEGRVPAAKLATHEWRDLEWRYFILHLPPSVSAAQLALLDKAFAFGKTHDTVLAGEWLRLAVAADYPPALVESEQYVMTVGRADLILPIYTQWMKTPRGTVLAKRVYRLVHSGYDPEVTKAVEAVVGALPEDKSEP